MWVFFLQWNKYLGISLQWNKYLGIFYGKMRARLRMSFFFCNFAAKLVQRPFPYNGFPVREHLVVTKVCVCVGKWYAWHHFCFDRANEHTKKI